MVLLVNDMNDCRYELVVKRTCKGNIKAFVFILSSFLLSLERKTHHEACHLGNI